MKNGCLFCGEHPGATRNGTVVKDFCGKGCHDAWYEFHRKRGVDVVGFSRQAYLPIHETAHRVELVKAAIEGQKEARRELRQVYRIKSIYNPKTQPEERL